MIAAETPAPGARLRRHISLGSLLELPETSPAHGLSPGERVALLRAAGISGLQTLAPDPETKASGLTLIGIGPIKTPAEALPAAQRQRDLGFLFSTATVGTGFETDAEMDALAAAILEASANTGHPILIETHRASMTQDIFRTLALIERFPELRFNADLSHWFTGHELGADLEAFPQKLDRLAPLFSRVRYLHGRIGTTCCMQVGLTGADDPRMFVAQFREMWRRCFEGFLKTAGPEEWIGFAPELLPASLTYAGRTMELHYARLFPGPDGTLREETDRWAQSLILFEIAEAAFAQALGGARTA